jgi:dynamin 1-like protein
MEQLIPILNKLQDLLAPVGMHVAFDLPQLVVVGSQSVGKSSVLESLVGRDFLPRGTGIVTRRPLILQLRNLQTADPARPPKEWGEFQHLPNKKFEDFDHIRLEIIAETERLCGKNSGISSNPINLKIYSPHVIDLTLVDLPGITKIPVGDQPSDIELRVRELIVQYISKPNCLILGVTAANTDIANSDALKLAREFDQDGSRTIGVITKLDSMDEGTDCLDVLLGKVYPLKQGFVGVVCRSQKDIMAKKSIRESLKSEEKYFRAHPVYKAYASQCGALYMARLLHKVLMYHIRDTLPALKQRISEMLGEYEAEISGLGEPLEGEGPHQAAIVLNLFTIFSRNFQDAIEGKFHSSQLVGGARIHYIFYDVFAKAIYQFDSFSGLSDQEIRTAIRNATGPRTALFVPEIAFETLVKRQIAKLEEPALQCAEQVNEELHRVIMHCELSEMRRFTLLRDKMYDVVKSVLRRCLKPTKELISNLIRCELAYINTNHPDFIGGSRAISAIASTAGASSSGKAPPSAVNPPAIPPSGTTAAQSRPPQNNPSQNTPPPNLPTTIMYEQQNHPSGGFFSSLLRSNGPPGSNTGGGVIDKRRLPLAETPPDVSSSSAPKPAQAPPSLSSGGLKLAQVPEIVVAPEEPTDRERIETDIIKSLILSYFNIVKRNICDLVPKTIMHFTVNASKDILQKELVTQLYRQDMFENLLKEPDDVSDRRNHCKDMLEILKEAIDVIGQLRDFNMAAPAPNGTEKTSTSPVSLNPSGSKASWE